MKECLLLIVALSLIGIWNTLETLALKPPVQISFCGQKPRSVDPFDPIGVNLASSRKEEAHNADEFNF